MRSDSSGARGQTKSARRAATAVADYLHFARRGSLRAALRLTARPARTVSAFHPFKSAAE